MKDLIQNGPIQDGTTMDYRSIRDVFIFFSAARAHKALLTGFLLPSSFGQGVEPNASETAEA